MKTKTRAATFSAWWEADPNQVLYSGEPYGNLIGLLPLGAVPADDPASTLHLDGEAAWQHAVFITLSGRRIIVERDE